MGKFRLGFGLHNHQPVGNFDAVFDNAHRKAYLPFIKLLKQYPNIRISLHQSGILWDWQLKADPRYFELVGEMVNKDRLELLTGGFYEPILTAVPERDAVGQIEMLSRYLQDHFKITPDGLWLTERIWEPHLPRLLDRSGINYLPVDDTHFLYAGLQPSQLTGPLVTESEGHRITLLPILKRLRYLIPFGTVEEVIDELKRMAERFPEGMAVYADDGEKFGVWPGTHQLCFKEKWLEEFFDTIAANDDWLEVVPLGDLARSRPVGRAYLPSASYAEMLHWALPTQASVEYQQFEDWLKEKGMTEKYGRFVRGGHWRGFLTKYEEANLMHKKMQAVSDRLNNLETNGTADQGHLAAARNRLYAGQCNCSYWHGVFGGLYLPHIRQAAMSSLIGADALLNQLEKTQGIQIRSTDFDIDGNDEIVVSGDIFTAVIKPDRGGTLTQLALNKQCFDPTDTMTRRREGYHSDLSRAVITDKTERAASIHDLILAKESGLEQYLVEDWYLKRCFIDHFFTDDVDLDRFQSGHFGEEGDFILEPFTFDIEADPQEVRLIRTGNLWRPQGAIPVKLAKTFRFEPDSDQFRVSYDLSTLDEREVAVNFAVENNLNFQAGHAEDRFILVDSQRTKNAFLDSTRGIAGAESFAIVDEYRNLAVGIQSDRSCELWHLPIFTVSLSEGGFEKVYQGTTFIQLFKLILSPRKVSINISFRIGQAADFNYTALSTADAGSR